MAGKHVEAVAAEAERPFAALLDRLAEARLASRHGGVTVSSLEHVAGGNVELDDLAPGRLAGPFQVLNWRGVGEGHLHRLETGGAGGAQAFEEGPLAEQHRDVGREAGHPRLPARG